MNPFNFNEDNLVKVSVSVMNRLLNNHLLSSDRDLNLLAIQTLELETLTKQMSVNKM